VTIRSAKLGSQHGARIDLRVPVFRQRDAECGNTSLKSVLAFLGKRLSARTLAGLASATTDGIEHAGLVAAARWTGAEVFERTDGSVAELRWFLTQGLPAIVGWWSPDELDVEYDERWSLAERRARDCGHFSVICGIDRDRILLMDPLWRIQRRRRLVIGRRWMTIRQFHKRWYDTDTETYARVDRWYMVAHFDGRRFSSIVGGGIDHEARLRRATEARA
jgi:hypothetical protein